ncbi:hypothetical protein SKPI104516_18375 [Skermania piniformis]
MIKLRERFFRWEEGRRHSFGVTESNVPLLSRFAEDYLVEPMADGSRFTWTIAAEMKAPLRRPNFLGSFPLERIMRTLEADTRQHFERATST